MDRSHRPYFLWWTSASVADLRAHLADPDPEVRAYWMGALLREANTRDVWLFVTPETIRASWDRLQRHRSRVWRRGAAGAVGRCRGFLVCHREKRISGVGTMCATADERHLTLP